jgi:hypothetical protein
MKTIYRHTCEKCWNYITSDICFNDEDWLNYIRDFIDSHKCKPNEQEED